MNNRKAQSAMEYLMTYGWAILVVLIALGALFYLGVFNPKTANSCVAGAPITCSDVKITAGATDVLTLSVGATGTSSATLGTVALTAPAVSACGAWTGGTISTAALTPATCTLVADVSKDAKFAGTVGVTYTLQGGISHTASIQISGTVE